MSRYSYMIVDPVSAFDGEELPRLFDFVRACGYEGVELNYSRELGASLGRVRGYAAESGLEIPSILTGRGYEEGLCLCHPEAAVRGAAVAYLVELLAAAAECGSILVIGLLQGLRSDEPDPGAAQPRIAACLREVAAAAEEKGVELVIEPINHLQVGFNNSVAEVRALAAQVASPALGPMVDTIHMNIEDPSLTQPIRDCGADLRHVHLCESNGGLFGSGNIDFASVLRVLDGIGYGRFASVKIYRNATHREAARSSIEHLRRLGG